MQENCIQDSSDVQVDGFDHSRNLSVLQLLQSREHNSGMNKTSYSDRGFRRQFLEGQAAHPQVKYRMLTYSDRSSILSRKCSEVSLLK